MRSTPEGVAPLQQPFEEVFGQVILEPDRPEPDFVIGPHGKAAAKRFNVYRNNVTHSLVTALAEIFPATALILGERNFRMIARDFLRANPPRSRLVFEYGHGLPDHLAAFEPIRHLAYLPDVARLERAWLDAYHAADQAPLWPGEISAIPPEALAKTRFTPHPAMRLVRSDYAIHTIFVAHRGGPMPHRIDAGVAENVLVTRPALQVEVRRVEPSQAVFLLALGDGAPLQEAVEWAAKGDPCFDLAAAIGLLIESGAFSACQPATHDED
ncbi:DNA-binding domain-containing protein [Nitratireductor soli]|uniref:HvfC/BufC N-terminal domain-containing protein n=1 Tax=Nitratireductor soli TaxID=1670619 RepID=UPI00065E58BB|nr:DNA-binding domain-containing protein [Nitratireductor soli]